MDNLCTPRQHTWRSILIVSGAYFCHKESTYTERTNITYHSHIIKPSLPIYFTLWVWNL